jgi:O-antigen/teichoic acid export membrane protein
VLGIGIILNGLKNVKIAYVSKKMQYKMFFFSSLGGTLVSAVVGLWMAFRGFGVWALVAQLLTNNAIDTLILWITVEWRPRRVFSASRLKGLFSFGWKIFFSNLFGSVCENLNQLIVGKVYSTTDLAYYNKGAHFPEITISNLLPAIDGVLFPTLSEEQTNLDTVRTITKKGLRISNYVVFPVMVGLAVCADSLIGFLLTEKWLLCVPFLQIFCFRSVIRPFINVNVDAINAIGRSDVTLKLEMLKRILGIVLLVVSIPYGVKALAWSTFISLLVSYLVTAVVSGRIIHYGLFEQLKDNLPNILLTSVMGVSVWGISMIDLGYGLTLLLQVVSGIAVYWFLSAAFRMREYNYILGSIKEFFKK